MNFRPKNIKHSLSRWLNLLIDPKKEWDIIAQELNTVRSIFIRFAFPVITVCSLLAFAGGLIHTGSLSIGISQLAVSFLSLNLAFFVAGKMIKLLAPNFQLEIKSETIYQLIIYSGSIFCLFHSLAKLFPNYSFLNQICLVFELYFIRVLWLGIPPLLTLSENKKPGFTIMASLLILVLPLIFERMFSIIFKLPVTI
ncbi:MAG: YIP1 family protein [Labilibaculum antarcticum]